MHFVELEEWSCLFRVMGIPALWVHLQEMIFPGQREKLLSFSWQVIDVWPDHPRNGILSHMHST